MRKYSLGLFLVLSQVCLGSLGERLVADRLGAELKIRSVIFGDSVEKVRSSDKAGTYIWVKSLPFVIVEIEKSELWYDGVSNGYLGAEAYKAVEKSVSQEINIEENHGFFKLYAWLVKSEADLARFDGDIRLQ